MQYQEHNDKAPLKLAKQKVGKLVSSMMES